MIKKNLYFSPQYCTLFTVNLMNKEDDDLIKTARMRTTKCFSGIILWPYHTRSIEVQVVGNTVTGSGPLPPTCRTAIG